MGNDTITFYQLEYSLQSTISWEVLTTTPYLMTTFNHTLASGVFNAGAAYYYRIKAWNNVGAGPYSTYLSIVANNVPQGMNTPAGGTINPMNVTITWA